jgi:hypothetical protein
MENVLVIIQEKLLRIENVLVKSIERMTPVIVAYISKCKKEGRGLISPALYF